MSQLLLYHIYWTFLKYGSGDRVSAVKIGIHSTEKLFMRYNRTYAIQWQVLECVNAGISSKISLVSEFLICPSVEASPIRCVSDAKVHRTQQQDELEGEYWSKDINRVECVIWKIGQSRQRRSLSKQ